MVCAHPAVLIVNRNKQKRARFARNLLSSTFIGVLEAETTQEAQVMLRDERLHIGGILLEGRRAGGLPGEIKEVLAGCERLRVVAMVITEDQVRPQVGHGHELDETGDLVWIAMPPASQESHLGWRLIEAYYLDNLKNLRYPSRERKAMYCGGVSWVTYIQELPSRRYVLSRPIEIICRAEDGITVTALASSDGLAAQASGASAYSAVCELSRTLTFQFDLLRSKSRKDLSSFSRLLLGRMRHVMRELPNSGGYLSKDHRRTYTKVAV